MCSPPPHCLDEQLIEESFTESSLPSDASFDYGSYQFPPLTPKEEMDDAYWGSGQDYFPNVYYARETADWMTQEKNPTVAPDGEEEEDLFLDGDYLELNDLEDHHGSGNQMSGYTYRYSQEGVESANDILMWERGQCISIYAGLDLADLSRSASENGE